MTNSTLRSPATQAGRGRLVRWRSLAGSHRGGLVTSVFSDATQMAATGEAMIELIGVQKFFGTFQALRDI